MCAGACSRLELVLVITSAVVRRVHRLARLVGYVVALLRVLPCVVIAVVLRHGGGLLLLISRLRVPTLARLAFVVEVWGLLWTRVCLLLVAILQ